MITKRFLILAMVMSLILTIAPAALAQTPPDVIKEYVISIEPQADGALKMKYDFNYCATTDFPANSGYLEVGVPNSNFSLTDYGPKDWVTSAAAKNGSTSQVHLDFAHVPKAGECFSFSFTILQQAMAYPSDTGVSFVFTPGWFDFAKIEKLSIRWQLPKDISQVKGFDPAPKTQDDGLAVWEAENLAPNQKFTVKITIDKTVFPQLAVQPTQAPATSGGEGSGSIDPALLCLGVVLVVAVFLVVAWLVYSPSISDNKKGDDDYTPGTYIGGHHSTPRYDPPSPRYSPSPTPRYTPPPPSRSGGDSGSFGGRGGSCACVSCACACACAGGGRAGCAEKGFDVSGLMRKRDLSTKE